MESNWIVVWDNPSGVQLDSIVLAALGGTGTASVTATCELGEGSPSAAISTGLVRSVSPSTFLKC